MADKKVEIIPHVSEAQCKKAIDALHQWATKQSEKDAENQLLPGKEPTIWLCVALKKSPSGMTFKPVRIPIVHPLVDPRTNRVCLLTKDPQREYKDLLESHDIKFISRVVGLEKLRGKFKPFEARRALLKENGLFLADQSIIPLLPKLLGVKWFEAKKQPIPVCMTRKDLKAELERAISSTYMNQNKGTAVSIKIGTLSQKPSQILANLRSALPAVVSHIKGGKGGWDNIQGLGIKTNNSMHLPIWSCALDDSEGGRWEGLTLGDDDVDMKDDEGESEDEKEEVVNAPARKGAQDSPVAPKGTKKRAVEDEDEDALEKKPKKKAKSRDTSSTEDVPSKHSKRATEVSKPVVDTPVSTDNKTKTKKRKKSDVATPSTDVISTTPKPTLSKPVVSTLEATASIRPGQTKKTKAAAEGTPNAMQVDPSPSVAPTATVESKPKKKKGKQAEVVVAEPTPVEAPVEEPSQTQKTKKKKGRASEATAPTIVEEVMDKALAPSVDASKTEKKKKKDRKKTVSAEDAPAPTDEVAVPDPAVEEVASASTKQSKKEKRKADKADVETVIEAKETVTADILEERGEKKKRKKVKKTEIAAGGDVIETEKESAVSVQKTPTLSKEELKQKKATGGAGEKKKEKVVKSKGGKSAKDVLLGKKAAH